MKNALKLLEAIGKIQDDFILDAHNDLQRSVSSRKKILLIAAIAAVLLLLAGCAVCVWNWYSSFFTLQREEPLSDSQISYIHENAREMHESQTCNGYTIELKSAIAETQTAYITFQMTAPEEIDLDSHLEEDALTFRDLFATPAGSQLPAAATCEILDDGDGKKNTVNIVFCMKPGGLLGENVSFGAGSSWRIVFLDIITRGYDREYEEELLRTKYAGVTDFMFEDEEVQRIYSETLLATGKWVFEVELSAADPQSLELLPAPILTRVVVTRKEPGDTMFFETKDAVEAVTITSIQLRPLGATVRLDPPGPKENDACSEYYCSWINMAQKNNPLCVNVSEEEAFFVMLKDGTRINFQQTEGATDTAFLQADSPIVLQDVDYLQLSDGTRIPVPGAQ